MTAADDFAAQLRDLGFDVTVTGLFVTFPFEIQSGGRSGLSVTLGIEVPSDFPATPPSGPHVRPKLGHPHGRVHPSPGFGTDGEYWSRPFELWPATNRSASDYMSHVRLLFSQL